MLAQPQRDRAKKAVALAGGLGGALLAGGLIATGIAKPRAMVRLLKDIGGVSKHKFFPPEYKQRVMRQATNLAQEVLYTPQKYLSTVRGVRFAKVSGDAEGVTHWGLGYHELPATLGPRRPAIKGAAITRQGNVIGEESLPQVIVAPGASPSTYTHEMIHATQKVHNPSIIDAEMKQLFEKQTHLDLMEYIAEQQNILDSWEMQYLYPYGGSELHAFRTTGIAKDEIEALGGTPKGIANPEERMIWHPKFMKHYKAALRTSVKDTESVFRNLLRRKFGPGYEPVWDTLSRKAFDLRRKSRS